MLTENCSNDNSICRWNNPNLLSSLQPINRPSPRSLRNKSRPKPARKRKCKARHLTTHPTTHKPSTNHKSKQPDPNRQCSKQDAYRPNTRQTKPNNPSNGTNARDIESEFVLPSSGTQTYAQPVGSRNRSSTSVAVCPSYRTAAPTTCVADAWEWK